MPKIDNDGQYDHYKKYINTNVYDNTYFYKYEGKRVVYLGFCDYDSTTNTVYWKYGISRRVGQRDIDELSKEIKKFRLVYVRESTDNDIIEVQIKKELKYRSLLVTKKFGRKSFTEIFTTTSTFTIDNVKEMIDHMIDDNDKCKKSNELLLAEEITKQKQLELHNNETILKYEQERTRQLELQIKLNEMNKSI